MTTAHDRGPLPQDLVQSVSRALRVLEVVTSRPGLPVKAIARRAGLNLSTTYHLVRTLAYEGYLLRRPDGCYDVGGELPRRFHDAVDALGRPPQTRAVLGHLVQVTGLSAYAGRLGTSGMVVAEVVEGPGSPYLEDFEVGLEVAAHATALGKALLASMPAGRRRAYLRDQGLRTFTSATVTDVGELERWASAVDLSRLVVEHGEFREGVSCAAALVPRSSTEEAAWAVVLSSRSDDLPTHVEAELLHAARHLAAV